MAPSKAMRRSETVSSSKVVIASVTAAAGTDRLTVTVENPDIDAVELLIDRRPDMREPRGR